MAGETGPDSAYAERSWQTRDGLTLYARDYQGVSGPALLPVICLHGLTRNSSDFEDVAPAIAALGRRVLVPDTRGRGRSDRDANPMNYKVPTYARDMLTMMDALGISRAVFIGTSMGGLITMAIAGFRRRAIAGAVLNDVGPAIAMEGVRRITAYAGKAVPVETWDDAATYTRATMGAAFPRLPDDAWPHLARRVFREDESGIPVLDYDSGIAQALAAQQVRSSSWLAWRLFRRLGAHAPVMLVRGEQSDLLTAPIAQRMRRAVTTLEIVEVEGVGHAPMLSEPEAAEAIARFLRRLP